MLVMSSSLERPGSTISTVVVNTKNSGTGPRPRTSRPRLKTADRTNSQFLSQIRTQPFRVHLFDSIIRARKAELCNWKWKSFTCNALGRKTTIKAAEVFFPHG